MGFVATAGRKVPLPKVMRCVRADAVGRQPGYTGRANWLLPAHRNRAPLAAWLGDDRLGTFLAAVPTSPPQPEDMYRLRLLDEGGEGTGEQRQQAQKVMGSETLFLLTCRASEKGLETGAAAGECMGACQLHPSSYAASITNWSPSCEWLI